MAASFASRLSGLREKKITSNQTEQGLRLTLPPDLSQKSSYEPSTSSNTRTSFRLLKGRIDRKQSSEKPDISSANSLGQSNGLRMTQKLSINEQLPQKDLKLFLSESGPQEEKRPLNQPPKVPLQKRILIAKENPKEEVKREQPPRREEYKRQDLPPPPPKMEKQSSKQYINVHEQKPIHEEDAEESLPAQSQNDLVMCPQGCGRKFNRKALEKHAKACKLVFMSKRKEFNSEAKRISKQQAAVTKQTKNEQKKKMGVTRGKGFGATKTGQNWKAASEDFRSAVKAMKKDQKQQGGQEEEIQIDSEAVTNAKEVVVLCQYCQKQFNEVFIDKHLQNCTKKKQKERGGSKKRPPKK